MSVFSQQTILEAQDNKIPEDVKEEITRLWKDAGLGNDFFYYPFDVAQSKYDMEEYPDEVMFVYPTIIKYLEDNGVEECLIHFWW